ncbi:DUF4259 domain-containing protein [Streptacidiphilus sp. P02-A3a]|nr:DUF4259 domain-containing protein [Streptacidiphilus sp. P02-A3a]QMU74243.1 DUF4259 domain-containing protein [Streptacidiphilus sp. P02-A3a]
MGTWDVGPFDNDTAGDFCDALDEVTEGSREALVRDRLVRVIDIASYLDADVAQEAIAAAALTATQCPGGEPANPHYGPKQPLPDLLSLREFAAQALDRITTEPSELMELWSQADAGLWQASMISLRNILLPQRPDEDLRLL